MITTSQYFINREASNDIRAAAIYFLLKVNKLLEAANDAGVDIPINPKTGSQISGTTEGGFRLCTCTQGAPNSSHREGRGVDLYDPHNALDNWLDDAKLEQYGLFREHPDATPLWCHLTDRPPHSGKRTFLP